MVVLSYLYKYECLRPMCDSIEKIINICTIGTLHLTKKAILCKGILKMKSTRVVDFLYQLQTVKLISMILTRPISSSINDLITLYYGFKSMIKFIIECIKTWIQDKCKKIRNYVTFILQTTLHNRLGPTIYILFENALFHLSKWICKLELRLYIMLLKIIIRYPKFWEILYLTATVIMWATVFHMVGLMLIYFIDFLRSR